MTDSNSDQFNDPYAFSEEHQDSVVLSRKASKRVKITKEVSSVTKALKMDVDPQPESSDQLTHELDAHKHEMCTIGVETESAYLGPCEPGTSVVLEGIVWHESDSGILVINVTWRGKKYIGTLLDSSRHEWAPPNFSPNNTAGSTVKEKSPVKLRGRRGRGGKRTVPAPHRSPRKWSSTASVSSEPGKSSDEMKPSATVDTSVTCSEAKCSKKFRGVNCKDALEYHKIHAHASSSMVSVSDMDNASDKKGTEKMDSSVKAEVKTESELNVKAEVKVDNSEKHQNIGASNLQSSNVANDNKLRENAVLRSVNQTNSKSIEFASKSSSSTVSSSNKKINTPVAVLRPLVPQQMSSQDGKPMSSNPSQTMNVPRIIPQNRNSINLPQVPRTDFMSNAQQFVPNNSNLQVINRHHFPGIIPSSQTVAPNSNNRNVPFFPPGVHMAAPVPNVRTTERSQGRNSLTYSDISDASDQEGEVTHRQAVRNPNRGNRDPSIEDRLFCSEELTANSPPLNNANQNTGVQYSPSISSTTASNTPVKSNNNALPGNNASKPAGATTFSNTNLTPPPHMLTTQPQPVMYPYLPFMQTTQVPGCSVSFHPPPAAPIYAATPYLMTYAGMPQFIQPQQQYGNVPNPNQQFHRMPVTEPNVPTSKTN